MPISDTDVIEAPLEDTRPAATLHLADLEHPCSAWKASVKKHALLFGRDIEMPSCTRSAAIRCSCSTAAGREDEHPQRRTDPTAAQRANVRFDYSNEHFALTGCSPFPFYRITKKALKLRWLDLPMGSRMREELAPELPRSASWFWLRSTGARSRPPSRTHPRSIRRGSPWARPAAKENSATLAIVAECNSGADLPPHRRARCSSRSF